MYWSEGTVTAVTGVVSSIVAGYGGYLAAKRKNKMTEREQLSKDEQIFRKELRSELKSYREEVIKLQSEIAELRKANIKLELENQQLIIKIDELTKQLKIWERER